MAAQVVKRLPESPARLRKIRSPTQVIGKSDRRTFLARLLEPSDRQPELTDQHETSESRDGCGLLLAHAAYGFRLQIRRSIGGRYDET